jgi:hypothetical protein
MKNNMEKVSDCCGAAPWLSNGDFGICGDCKEHCEFVYVELE